MGKKPLDDMVKRQLKKQAKLKEKKRTLNGATKVNGFNTSTVASEDELEQQQRVTDDHEENDDVIDEEVQEEEVQQKPRKSMFLEICYIWF